MSYWFPGLMLADITTYLGPDSYSGVIFLGSCPFRSWNPEIISPWFRKMFSRYLSPDLPDLCSTAREFVEAFAFDPDRVPPATKLSWIGAYAIQHPAVKANFAARARDEDALKGVTGKIPVLVLLGKEDKFVLSNRLGELFKETFADAEVHIWPGVGHVTFFEEPEKTRDVILAFVKRVAEVRSCCLQVSPANLTCFSQT